jgi:nucleotide-binding universal stress UspA family protein
MPKVLAAIDGSEHAVRALCAVSEMFGNAADYVLLSIVPPWSLAAAIAVNEELRLAGDGTSSGVRTHGASTGATQYTPTSDNVDATNDALYDFYRTAQRQAASAAGITRFEPFVEEARPQKRRIGREICESADAYGADMIVIGSHGSSHTGELLLGSVSQYVLHHASCPVLVVRGGG